MNTHQHTKQREKVKCTWVSIWVNLVLVLLQMVAGFFMNALSLIADGLHSLSDIFSDIVVLLATRFNNPADKEHPYGHHRFEDGASLFLGVILIIVGVGIMIPAIESLWKHAFTNTPISIWAAAVALVVLVVKELLFQYMMYIAKKIKSKLLMANAWHARADAMSSLVVLAGLIGASAGYAWLDKLAALIVGLLITKAGIQFGWHALKVLMDFSVPAEDLAIFRQTAMSIAGVVGVHDLKGRHAGDGMLIDIHIEVNGQLTVKEGHDIAHAVGEKLREIPHVIDVLVHVDPV
jgi:cation diffusion facilitator family transporter